MKSIIKVSLVFILVLLFSMTSCKSSGGKTAGSEIDGPVERIEVSIGGMSCTGCEETIQTSVAKLEGVKSVTATFTTGKAFVDYIPAVVDTSKIRKAITQVGYHVKGFNPAPVNDSVK